MARGIAVALTNEDKGYIFSEWTEELDVILWGENPPNGDIFRQCQREYGRCVSRMYRDSSTRGTREVGWVFEKREHYSDYHSSDTYLQHAWVEVGEYVGGTPEHVEN